jgi:hypothetical protein
VRKLHTLGHTSPQPFWMESYARNETPSDVIKTLAIFIWLDCTTEEHHMRTKCFPLGILLWGLCVLRFAFLSAQANTVERQQYVIRNEDDQRAFQAYTEGLQWHRQGKLAAAIESYKVRIPQHQDTVHRCVCACSAQCNCDMTSHKHTITWACLSKTQKQVLSTL